MLFERRLAAPKMLVNGSRRFKSALMLNENAGDLKQGRFTWVNFNPIMDK